VLTVPAIGDELEQFGGHRDVIADSIRMAPVYEALGELSQPLREAVVAVDVIGLSYRDAARPYISSAQCSSALGSSPSSLSAPRPAKPIPSRPPKIATASIDLRPCLSQ
jgi:hypothetical protein